MPDPGGRKILGWAVGIVLLSVGLAGLKLCFYFNDDIHIDNLSSREIVFARVEYGGRESTAGPIGPGASARLPLRVDGDAGATLSFRRADANYRVDLQVYVSRKMKSRIKIFIKDDALEYYQDPRHVHRVALSSAVAR